MGLTGDVGAGKSVLAALWREMGAQVVDADELAKRQWDDPAVRLEAERRWGKDFLSGGKKDVHARIAAKIFNDEAEYLFATKVIHEATRKKIAAILEAGSGWIVLEIPLLFESGLYDSLDYIVYATAARGKRLLQNSSRGWDDGELARRERWFMPREEKIRRADFVLENDGTVDQWREKGRELGRFFLKSCR